MSFSTNGFYRFNRMDFLALGFPGFFKNSKIQGPAPEIFSIAVATTKPVASEMIRWQ